MCTLTLREINFGPNFHTVLKFPHALPKSSERTAIHRKQVQQSYIQKALHYVTVFAKARPKSKTQVILDSSPIYTDIYILIIAFTEATKEPEVV